MLLYNPVKPEQILRTESRIQVRNLLHASHRRTPASSLLGILRQSPQIGITVLHRCDSGTVGRVRRPACCVGSVYSHSTRNHICPCCLLKSCLDLQMWDTVALPRYHRIHGYKERKPFPPSSPIISYTGSRNRYWDYLKNSRILWYDLKLPVRTCMSWTVLNSPVHAVKVLKVVLMGCTGE